MKILWLTPLFPYPPFSGGQTRAYNLLKNLAKKNEITLFSFWRPKRIQGPKEELEKFCHQVKIFKGRPTWTLRNLLLAGFSHLPFAITHFYGDQAVEEAIREELSKEKYDLVHFESFYTSPYLKSDFDIPTVLGNENIEYLIYRRFTQEKKFFPLRMMFTYDVWKMKHYEQAAWKRADLNLMVSETDAQEVEKVTGKKCFVIPNGVDLRYFKLFEPLSPKRRTKTLLFVGDFRYFANQEAVRFLVKEIWPKIKKGGPRIRLWLVGKNANQFIKNLVSKDLIVDERVRDIRQAYNQADILAAPMQIASGTNIKVLEAMASRLPVVTTSAGIEGIKAKDGREVIVRDHPQEFAGEVVKLLGDEKRRQELGRAGRALVEKLYDWSKIAQKLEEAYRGLIS